MSTPLFSSALPSLTAVGQNRRGQPKPVATCRSHEDQENDSVRRTRPSPTLRGTTPGVCPNLVAEERRQHSTPAPAAWTPLRWVSHSMRGRLRDTTRGFSRTRGSSSGSIACNTTAKALPLVLAKHLHACEQRLPLGPEGSFQCDIG